MPCVLLSARCDRGWCSCFRIHAPENGILAEHAVQGFLNDAEKYLTATLAGWSVLRLTASKKGDESLLQQFYQKRLGLPRNEFTEDFSIEQSLSEYLMDEHWEEEADINGVPVRIMTVDVQKGHFYAVIRAWSSVGASA